MPLDVARHAVGDRTLIRVRLLDRRLSPPREDDFLFDQRTSLAELQLKHDDIVV